MSKDQSLSNNPLFQLLVEEDIKKFNQMKAEGNVSLDLSGAHLRGLDLRHLDAKGLILKDAYLRGADLRGIDFRQCEMEGASMAEAKVSGTYFPDHFSAEEIRLSIEKGTRLRPIKPTQ